MSRFQFSLRMMLAAVAVVGIGAALWTAEPSWQVGAIEFLLVPWVLGSTMLLSVHSTGRIKAFWTGVAAECVWPVLVYLPVAVVFSLPHSMVNEVPSFLHFPNWFPFFLLGISGAFQPVVFAWAFAPIVGLLCVFTHWLFILPPQGPKG